MKVVIDDGVILVEMPWGYVGPFAEKVDAYAWIANELRPVQPKPEPKPFTPPPRPQPAWMQPREGESEEDHLLRIVETSWQRRHRVRQVRTMKRATRKVISETLRVTPSRVNQLIEQAQREHERDHRSPMEREYAPLEMNRHLAREIAGGLQRSMKLAGLVDSPDVVYDHGTWRRG